MKKHNKCLVCSSVDYLIIGSVSSEDKNVDVCKCRNCSHTFTAYISQDENGTSSSNATLTTESYIQRMIEASNKDNLHLNEVGKNRLNYFEKKLGFKEFNILEIGSGAGGFGAALVNGGLAVANYVGVELDAALTEVARARGLNVINNDFMDAEFEVDSFNIIMFTQVLEHINEPQAFLIKVKKLLKKHENTILYIEVPNHYSLAGFFSRLFGGLGIRLGSIQWPFHCSSYSKKSLTHLLESIFPESELTVFTVASSHKVFGQGGDYGLKERIYFFLSKMFLMKSMVVGIAFSRINE